MASYSGNSNKYGRQTIYINQTEQMLKSYSPQEIKKVLASYIPLILETHKANKERTRYLWDYYLGLQDIKDKVKHTRDEINNKKVENWAYAIVDFKKAWQLGNPIQYVMINSTSSEEIEQLNKFVRYQNKEAKDQWIYEDVLVTGRGFRYQNKLKSEDEDDAPFEIQNIDRDTCEVVYSKQIGHEQLFSVVITDMEETILKEDGSRATEEYKELTFYLRNRQIICQVRNENYKWEKEKPIILNEHVITEYYVNRDRISLIEIGKDLFDGINQLESLDFDDLEQFVNALMVFTNAEVNEEEMAEIKKLGAVSIKSTENKKASVALLQNRLSATDTQTFYTRLLTSLHQILGIPMATDNGSVTSGDTGKAKMTGQGYTSAGIRAKTDETMFKSCDFNSLKVLLKICKAAPNSKIKQLKAVDVDSKMNRDMSDNLLVKTQALMNLLQARIPKEYALPIINLFSDSNAVVQVMEKNEEEQLQLAEQQMNVNDTNKANAQNNKINNAEQMDLQDQ